MFVDVHMYDTNVKLLVDTGATVTMLSKASFEKMKSNNDIQVQRTEMEVYDDIQVQRTEMEVYVADSKQLTLEGKVDVEMQLGTRIFKVAALVADIQVDGILGLDVIKQFDMIIDTKHGSLTLQDEEIPLTYEGKFGCFRVEAQETLSISFRSKPIV
jgi:predicted aspartyl protease